MADEKLAEELAKHLADRDSRRSPFTDHLDAIGPAYRVEYRRAARAALEWLAERGRLVPEGAQVGEERATAIIRHREMRWPPTVPGAVPDGAKDGEMVCRTVITTPWVAVQPDHGKASDG